MAQKPCPRARSKRPRLGAHTSIGNCTGLARRPDERSGLSQGYLSQIGAARGQRWPRSLGPSPLRLVEPW